MRTSLYLFLLVLTFLMLSSKSFGQFICTNCENDKVTLNMKQVSITNWSFLTPSFQKKFRVEENVSNLIEITGDHFIVNEEIIRDRNYKIWPGDIFLIAYEGAKLQDVLEVICEIQCKFPNQTITLAIK